ADCLSQLMYRFDSSRSAA
ncbi:hypothetical protein L195_g049863, partial [Trifolium pratense]